MIFIHRELTFEIGEQTEEEITFWMISYQKLSEATHKQAQTFIQKLSRWCLTQGWQLETGDDDVEVYRPDEDDLPLDSEQPDGQWLGGD